MNLRISGNQLRFRITWDELTSLMEGTPLSLYLNLGAKVYVYQIVVDEDGEGLSFEVNDDSWQLKVGRKMMERFAASIPSREGIEEEIEVDGNKLILVLEVDVRRKS